MEMQVIPLEEEGVAVDVVAARGKVLNTEVEVSEAAEEREKVLTTEGKEETEASVYSTLRTPTEDIYSTAGQPLMKHQPAPQNLGKVRLYRIWCILLSIICLILVLVIIVLWAKLNTEKRDGGVGSQTGCQNQCPLAWRPFDNFCFYLSNTRLNWSESRTECQAKGGDLAIINQQNVQNFLTSQGTLMYWIGLSSIKTEWTWVNNTALVTRYFADENKWTAGHCGMLTAGEPPEKSWGRFPCHYTSYFICQREI